MNRRRMRRRRKRRKKKRNEEKKKKKKKEEKEEQEHEWGLFPVSLYFESHFLCFVSFYFEVLPARQEVDVSLVT